MSHDDLLHRLRTSAGFTTLEEAESALTRTLETLGYLLPNKLVRELAAALPHSCNGTLQAAIGSSDSARRLAHAKPACIPSELPPSALAEMQAVFGALFSVVPLDLIRTLDGALPAPLTGMFVRHAVSEARLRAAVPEPARAPGEAKPPYDVIRSASHAYDGPDK